MIVPAGDVDNLWRNEVKQREGVRTEPGVRVVCTEEQAASKPWKHLSRGGKSDDQSGYKRVRDICVR